LDEIISGYQQDSHATVLLAKLTTSPNAVPNFTIDKGLLKFKQCISVGNNPALQQKLIQALHSSPVGGHSGAPATIKRIQSLFAWPGMKKLILPLSRAAQHVSKPNWNESNIQGCYSHWQLLRLHGRLYPWTLLRVYQFLMDSIAF